MGKDSLITGLVGGIIAPPLAFSAFSMYNFPDRSIARTFLFYKHGNVLTHVTSLSVLINLLLFYYFLRTKKEEAARGVIGATFIYAFIVLILILAS